MKKGVTVKEVKSCVESTRPVTKDALKDYIKVFFDVDVPDFVLTTGHSSPMDYVWKAFNLDYERPLRDNGDSVVWASRGGGKTKAAAVVTALDCLFKPEIEIRILSGSNYQAGRMYDYFQGFIVRNFPERIAQTKTWPVRRTIFKNGAAVEVLVQSETSVRGPHVHKLRCDEVELFKRRVFEAAQYTTMSSKGYIAAREVISTMHRPNGLMKTLIDQAGQNHQPVFKWNVWEVLEPCLRTCKPCPLLDACLGKGKEAHGYYKIEDALTQLDRAKERFEVIVFMSLVSALIAASTGILSLIIAVTRGKG